MEYLFYYLLAVNIIACFFYGMDKWKALLPESQQFLSGAKYTAQIMEQAPVSVFVLNSLGKGLFSSMNEEERIFEVCNIQSVSAAIQNMLLAAEHKGIGSLWICDIFFAYEELCQWLGRSASRFSSLSIPLRNASSIPSFSFPITITNFQGCRFFAEGALIPLSRIYWMSSIGIS